MNTKKAYDFFIKEDYINSLKEYLLLSNEFGNKFFYVNVLKSINKLLGDEIISSEQALRFYEKEDFEIIRKILKKKIVISLTSFPARIEKVAITINSLLEQSFEADKVVIWLADDQFPNKEKDLPRNLLDLQSKGLIIGWTKDIKSYKKLIPSLNKFKDEIIVTADDDLIYPRDWLLELVVMHLKYPNDIICHRAHEILINGNSEILPYKEWRKEINRSNHSYRNFFTTGAGVLFPPKSLHNDVVLEELFLNLCPTADDIWVWGMAVMQGTKIYVVPNSSFKLKFWDQSQNVALWRLNVTGGANDVMLGNLFNHYPRILDSISGEFFDSENCLISIIIPVYNTGMYLEECLNSISKQSFMDFEVLCVNDGSTCKETLNILDKFSEKDNRFKIINQINSGPATARNNGLKNARGDYILFIDSDDYISVDFLKNMYSRAVNNNYDVVVCDKILCVGDGIENSLKKSGIELIDNLKERDILSEIIMTTGVSWNKLYRRDYLLHYDIKFLDGMNCPAEDNFFTIFAVIFSKGHIGVAEGATYYYRQHSNGITKNIDDKAFLKSIDVYVAALKNLEKYSIEDKDYWRNIIIQRAHKDLYYMARFTSNINDNKKLVSSKFKKQINICCIADSNYIKPTMVFLHSLRKSCSSGIFLNVNLLVPAGDYCKMMILNQIQSENISLNIKEVDPSLLLEAHQNKKHAEHCMASPSALFKFLIPDLFPDKDRMLYIDTDLIVRQDLYEVFMADFEGKYICAVADMWNTVTQDQFVKKFEFYFNSGFMLMNLHQMRLNNSSSHLINEKMSSENLNLMDQNVFNVVFDGAVKSLDIKYNFLPICYKRHNKKFNINEMNRIYKSNYSCVEDISVNPAVVHWAGSEKPWISSETLFADEWNEMFNEIKCLLNS